jgi:cardiolipin synthase
MDRRSFELNYENNILFFDVKLAAEVRQRQQNYLNSSIRVDRRAVAHWPVTRRLWNNAIAMLGPLL